MGIKFCIPCRNMDNELMNASASVPEFSLSGKITSAKVVSCYDGDTFQAVLHLGKDLWKFQCRMSGYDSPEMRPPLNTQNRLVVIENAVKAKHALLSQVIDTVDIHATYTNKQLDACVAQNKKLIQIHCKEFDKYGRLLVDVLLPNGSTVNTWMVENKYGYIYNGGTKQ